MTCTGPGCSRTVYAKQLCSSHYKQRAQGRPLTPLRPYQRTRGLLFIAAVEYAQAKTEQELVRAMNRLEYAARVHARRAA